MAISPDRVRDIFKGLETGDGAAFFEHVADDVDWTVLGSHPIAGHYFSKQAFIDGSFAKLGRVLRESPHLRTDHLVVDGDEAAVELRAVVTAKNGMRFEEHDCWVMYFKDGLIVRVRTYLDSALMARLFEENPIDLPRQAAARASGES